jgi:hypothetical protein
LNVAAKNSQRVSKDCRGLGNAAEQNALRWRNLAEYYFRALGWGTRVRFAFTDSKFAVNE